MREIVSNLSYLDFFGITVVSFLLLYFSFSMIAYKIFVKRHYFKSYQEKSFRPGQIGIEVERSMMSILIFGLLSFWICWGLRQGIYGFNYEFEIKKFALEVVALFFWNEIYFYAVHRSFHLKPLYKWHAYHHYASVPSPFSAYSFHWTEALALGAVMPVVMFFHDFQLYALLTLPVMSIFLNVLGHSNVDFFPKMSMDHLLSFSKRHSQHHKNPHKNFGFFLPYLDKLFGTGDVP